MGLQSGTEFRVDFHECLGNSHAESLGLTGDTTAIEVSLNVILTHQLGDHERLFYLILQSRHTEILLVIAVVDHNLTGTGLHIQTGNCGFSSA